MVGFILQESARQFEARGAGALSIKSFRHGQAHYRVGRHRFTVDDDVYLVLNQGEPYEIRIDADRPVESLCVFFDAQTAREVWGSLRTPEARLLDGGVAPGESVELVQRTHRHDDVVSPLLVALRAAKIRQMDQFWISERVHQLLSGLFAIDRRTAHEISQLGAIRASTRVELYQRLYRARDYIAACSEEPISLTEVAAVASLSVNHFLRSFKQLFGETPHQFLTACRLRRACQLLEKGNHSVTEVCVTVGFESLGSFSTLFRRRVGCSPVEYGRKKGDFREGSGERVG